ncbi:hypothetical protein OIU76_028853 [Salix suchowensis]|nr:hypothetical protein OIU76_028853 [Salix suchowensis]
MVVPVKNFSYNSADGKLIISENRKGKRLKQNTCMRGRSRIENLRTKFHYLFPGRHHREMFLHTCWHHTGDLF